MLDEVIPAAPVQPSEAAPAAPSVESPPVENTPATETPAAPVETPVADPEPTTTLLGEDKPKEEPKPDSGDQPADAPKPEDEGSQSDEPAPLPSYEEFTLPEGVQLDNEKLSEFTNILGEFQNVTKADNAEVQKFGQKLVDMYVSETKNTTDRIIKAMTNEFEKKKEGYLDAFVKDPEIGGNRQETSVNSALEFIRTHGGTAEQQTELRKLMNDSGLGNHPALIRIFAKAQSALTEGKPVPAQSPVPQSRSKISTRYGNAG